jgi:hypothetical protein
MKLDAIDLRILEAIQENGRITKLALAEKAGLSPTPCWLRLRKLEKGGHRHRLSCAGRGAARRARRERHDGGDAGQPPAGGFRPFRAR